MGLVASIVNHPEAAPVPPSLSTRPPTPPTANANERAQSQCVLTAMTSFDLGLPRLSKFPQ
jgi:hypothetical protein